MSKHNWSIDFNHNREAIAHFGGCYAKRSPNKEAIESVSEVLKKVSVVEDEDYVDDEDPIIMYLIVRESLGMSCGKTAAQVGHASQMLLLKYFDLKNKREQSFAFIEEVDLIKTFDKWLNSSFRKVVLTANENEWKKLKNGNGINSVNSVVVVDSGLTEVVPGTETVIGIFPTYKSNRPSIIKRLQLLK